MTARTSSVERLSAEMAVALLTACRRDTRDAGSGGTGMGARKAPCSATAKATCRHPARTAATKGVSWSAGRLKLFFRRFMKDWLCRLEGAGFFCQSGVGEAAFRLRST